MRTQPESKLIVFPVSLNLEGLLRNEQKFKANDPGNTLIPELDLNNFELPKGDVIVVQREENIDTMRKLKTEQQWQEQLQQQQQQQEKQQEEQSGKPTAR
jgi:hypothetical protein